MVDTNDIPLPEGAKLKIDHEDIPLPEGVKKKPSTGDGTTGSNNGSSVAPSTVPDNSVYKWSDSQPSASGVVAPSTNNTSVFQNPDTNYNTEQSLNKINEVTKPQFGNAVYTYGNSRVTPEQFQNILKDPNEMSNILTGKKNVSVTTNGDPDAQKAYDYLNQAMQRHQADLTKLQGVSMATGLPEPVVNAANAFAQGATEAVAALPKAVAVGEQALGSTLGFDHDIKDYAMYQIGDRMQNFIQENAPTLAEHEGFLTETAPRLAGQLGALALGGEATKVATGLASMETAVPVSMMAASQGVPAYEQTLQETGDQNKAMKSFVTNAAIGAIEGLPVADFLGKLNTATEGGLHGFISEGMKGGVYQGTVQAVGQALSNLDAQSAWDKSRDIMQGVGGQGAAGALLGGLMHGIGGIIGSKVASEPPSLDNEVLKAKADILQEKANEIGGQNVADVNDIAMYQPVKDKLQEKQQLQADLAKETDPATAKILQGKLAQVDGELQQLQKETVDKSLTTKAENRVVDDKQQQIDDIDESMDGKSDVSKQALQEQRDKLQNDISTIKPNREVRANQKLAVEEVADKLGIDKNVATYIHQLSKKGGEIEEPDGGITKSFFNKAEDAGLIEYTGHGDSRNLYDKTWEITDKGQKLIEAINGRIETRKGVKAGTDLFPNEANIPELKPKEDAVQEQKTTGSVLRNEGVQGESGLQGVVTNDQPEKTAGEGEQIGVQGKEEKVEPPEGERPPIGLSNEETAKLRKEVGLPERPTVEQKPDEDTLNEALDRMRENPYYTSELLAEHELHKTGIGKRYFFVDDAGLMALLARRIQLENLHEENERQVEQLYKDGKPEEAQIRQAAGIGIRDELTKIAEAAESAGTTTARALRIRQRLMHSDLSLAQIKRRMSNANNGEPFTDKQERQKFNGKTAEEWFNQREADKKELEKRIRDLEDAQKQKSAEQEVAKAVKSARKQQRRASLAEISTRKTALVERMKDKLKEFEKNYPLKSDITGGLATNAAKLAVLAPEIKEYVREIAAEGKIHIDDFVDDIHEKLKPFIPSLSKREVRDAISDYGKTSKPSADEINKRIAEIRAQGRLVSALEDAQSGKPPLKTGFQRGKPSDTVRELGRKVKAAMKEAGIETTDPEKQLKSALDAVKTRLRNSISDIETQLERHANGEPVEKEGKKGVEYDQEAKDLKAERDKLKDELDKISPKAEMTDEQRVKLAKGAVERSITELNRRIAEKDIAPKKGKPTPPDAELDKLKAERDKLKDSYADLKESIDPSLTPEQRAINTYKRQLETRARKLEMDANAAKFEKPEKQPPKYQQAIEKTGDKKSQDEITALKSRIQRANNEIKQGIRRTELANRSPYMKALAKFVAIEREFKLSSPATVGKLLSAAVQRTLYTPAEDAFGKAAVQWWMPQKVVDKAFREADFNTKAQVGAIADGYVNAGKQFGNILKTGKSDIEHAFGKESAYTPEEKGYMGRVHSALKSPAKEAEYALSFKKRLIAKAKFGIDITDKAVQHETSVEALKDAHRSIFMQDNYVSDAYQNMIKSWENGSEGKQALAETAKFLLPFVKVPTNIVGESMTMVGGVPKGIYKLAQAWHKGFDNMTPDEADVIMRQFKKGLPGLGFLAIGYMNPENFGGYYNKGEKRKAGDAQFDQVKLFGEDVPRWLTHTPMWNVMQLGATVRRLTDKSDNVGYAAGKGMLGLIGQTPFIDQMTGMQDLVSNPKAWDKSTGSFTKNTIDPAISQWLAAKLDKKDLTPESFLFGEPTKRQPKRENSSLGSTLQMYLDYVKTGVPYFREQVDEKGEKGTSQPTPSKPSKPKHKAAPL